MVRSNLFQSAGRRSLVGLVELGLVSGIGGGGVDIDRL